MTKAAYDALKKFGAKNQLRNIFRNSYALLGYSGPGEVDAVTQVIRLLILYLAVLSLAFYSS